MSNRKRLIVEIMLVLIAAVGGSVWGESLGDLARPLVQGHFGYFDGNRLKGTSESFRTGYATGVYDTLATVIQERSAIKNQSGVPLGYAGVKPWESLDNTEKLEAAGSLVISRVLFAILSVPDAVSSSQLREVVEKHLREHPEELHNTGAVLVWRAIAETDWK